MPFDLRTFLQSREGKVAGAGAAGVVGLALFMRSRAAKKEGGANVSMVPPANPPTSTADFNDALSTLNGATQAIVTAANALQTPGANPGTTPGAAGNTPTPNPGGSDAFPVGQTVRTMTGEFKQRQPDGSWRVVPAPPGITIPGRSPAQLSPTHGAGSMGSPAAPGRPMGG